MRWYLNISIEFFVTSFAIIDNNRLTGYIPWEHISLLNLTTLRLSEFLSKFQSIRMMSADFICLTITVQHFYTWRGFADNNNFEGSIPTEIGLLTKLTFLDLSKSLHWNINIQRKLSSANSNYWKIIVLTRTFVGFCRSKSFDRWYSISDLFIKKTRVS